MQPGNSLADEPPVRRSLEVLRQVGLGYLRLGQPATELSGGEAQRIKLATELQRVRRGGTLYVLDEPTTGLHPADVEKLLAQLDGLVDAGNTVIVVEHDMRVVAGSDWVIDIGPGARRRGRASGGSGHPEGSLSSRYEPDRALSGALSGRKISGQKPPADGFTGAEFPEVRATIEIAWKKFQW